MRPARMWTISPRVRNSHRDEPGSLSQIPEMIVRSSFTNWTLPRTMISPASGSAFGGARGLASSSEESTSAGRITKVTIGS
ncbi:hypothetical protein SRABI128_00258 [Microbacterium sp. Bi128]|nr:hypothetical protein SRABI128_00258 [Microbacterium sp. Bi128]